MIQIDPNDKVRAYINVKKLNDAEYVDNNYIVMCTKDGQSKDKACLLTPTQNESTQCDP